MLETVSIKEGIQAFVDWCVSLQSNIILYGHNAKKFDSKSLVKSLVKLDLISQFKEVVYGFADTLVVAKSLLPDMPSYSQSAIATRVLGQTYNAHNALDDVVMLQQICRHLNVTDNTFLAASVTVDWVIHNNSYHAGKRQRLPTLYPLIQGKILSKSMAEKVAASGLKLSDLRKAFDRGGRDGLKSLFTEKKDGNVRVTSRMSIIEKVVKYLESVFH